ncbi:hypothetical protein [Bacillus licheniformis]|uniref:hypothetical protein n=1 Tax=Bacillus licheniformis TaxID=1402 RepID=UPI000E6872A4|nr:hypothetical protein [Bacillus licheniformis]RIV03107.1 hypothetical protein D1862_05980 [Bacillus licheniformis]
MNDGCHQAIAAVSYYKTERTIDFNRQTYTKKQNQMCLYNDKILTASRQYRLEHVYDVSYRPFSEAGLLYLHTNKGVFAYEVNVDPGYFIEAFKKQKNPIK